jgi:hypothetical protein
MILAFCSICEYHEKVEIDCKLHSKCQKENCLSMYSNCVRDEAVKRFLSQNNLDVKEKPSSALEICYPLD